MIRGEHTYIRGTEQDDVDALYAFYAPEYPRAGLLDGRREPLLPNRDDLRDLLTRKEIADGSFYTVEALDGEIAGFCSLRGQNAEGRFAEYSLQLTAPALYTTPVAHEAHAFLVERAFSRLSLRKVLCHALAHEEALAAFLRSVGFHSAGMQRDVLYAGGTWQNLETFVLNNPAHIPTGH